MSTGELLFLGLVIVAMAVFALTLAYQSFAEWRWKKSNGREPEVLPRRGANAI